MKKQGLTLPRVWKGKLSFQKQGFLIKNREYIQFTYDVIQNKDHMIGMHLCVCDLALEYKSLK